MRYLGIDYGTKYIGLALSDDAGKMGFPHGVVGQSENVVQEIAELIKEEKVGAVVLGESRALDGSANDLLAESQRFADALRVASGIEISFEPEYYTTKQARDSQALQGKTGERADAVAAAIILSSYLDKHGNN